MRPATRDPSFEFSPNQLMEQARQQYLAACGGGGDGSPPDVEAFLAPFEEPERSAVRAELEKIRRTYVSPDSSGGSAGLAARGTKSDRTAETRQNVPGGKRGPSPGVDGTVEHVGVPDDTIDQIPGSDRTGEFVSALGATGEHVIASDVTGEHVSAPDATGEHVPAQDQTTDHKPREKPGTGTLPRSVAGYEIISVLGRGAMGVVYKAQQRGLKRLVALKMILSGEHASEQDLGRFRAEANAVAQLQHPGIVQIYEVGEDGGRPFFSLEFVDGPSLHKKLQGPPLPPKVIAALLRKMAEAMHYAHQRGVIHRDLKPANVLLTSDGVPKIGDFGLAKRLEDDESGLTRTGTVLGTPSYMSPEQAGGINAEIGPLADVYSLGAILYDMLTGRPPFRGTSVMDTLQQLRTREPVPPMQLQPGVPRDLETICLKCLEKDRTKRYADAGALAADLQRFLNGEPILARPISQVERLWRWCQRNPGKAATAAAAIVVVIAYAVTISVFNVQLDEQTKAALKAKDEAETQTGIALAQTKIANEKTGIALAQTKIANEKTEVAIKETESQKQTSAEALRGVTDYFNRAYDLFQSKRLSIDASPEVRKLRSDVLADMRKSLDNIMRKIKAASTSTNADLLAAELMGELLRKLGQSKEAREIFEDALKSAQQKVALDPNSDRARGNLGVIEQRLGDVALDLDGDARRARAHFLAARNLREEIRIQPRSGEFSKVEIQRIVAHDDVRLGRALLALGQAEESKRYFQEALGYYEEWLKEEPLEPKERRARPRSFVMQAQMYLGIAASNRGDVSGTEEHFGRALASGRGLLQDFPDYLPYKEDQVDVLGAYGDALQKFGKTVEARKHYLESLEILKFVMTKRPDDISNQPRLAETHERLGIAASLLKQDQEAKQNFKIAEQLRKELFEIERGSLFRQIGYVLALARVGERANAVRLANTIRTRMENSTELMLRVARTYAIFATDGNTDRKSHVEQALSALTIATGKDYKDAFVLETDPELASIREEAGFKELIARIKSR